MHARRHALAADSQTSWTSPSQHPSALDYLVASLAADLLAGFRREAGRAGVAIDEAELSLTATLDNPLVALGVQGETGEPRVTAIRGTMFVSAAAAEPALLELWNRSLARAPVHATLARSVILDLALRRVV
jgi:OsmC-like protein